MGWLVSTSIFYPLSRTTSNASGLRGGGSSILKFHTLRYFCPWPELGRPFSLDVSPIESGAGAASACNSTPRSKCGRRPWSDRAAALSNLFDLHHYSLHSVGCGSLFRVPLEVAPLCRILSPSFWRSTFTVALAQRKVWQCFINLTERTIPSPFPILHEILPITSG